jgi:hypothetical protein
MRHLPLVALPFLVAAVLAGCGSSAAVHIPPDGPIGSLSKSEYQLMAYAARKVKRADRGHDLRAKLQGLSEACDATRNGPSELIRAGYTGCLSLLAFMNAAVANLGNARVCEAEPGPAALDCLHRYVSNVASTARTVIASGSAANAAADARGIRGRCRDFIGIAAKQLRQLSRVARTSEALDQALQGQDPQAMNSSLRRLQASFIAFGNSSNADPLKQLRACR